MRRFLLVVLSILVSVVPALAFDTPEALIKAVYAPYSDPNFDWSNYNDATLRSKALNDLFDKDAKETPEDEVGRLDFDPYVDGQDYDLADFKIGTPKVEGDSATVEVTFKNFDQPEDLTFTLVKESDGWKVDDVSSWCSPPSRRSTGCRHHCGMRTVF